MKAWPLITPSSFLTPEYLPPSGWYGHAPFAFWLVDALRPKCVVELGVHHGFSYFTFCQAIDVMGIEATVHGIDTWRGDEHSLLYDEHVYDEVVSYNENYRKFSILHRGTFDEVASAFSDKSVDLLHIDGYHTYDAVAHDFATWIPKVTDGGVVLLHDTQVFSSDFGVYKLFAELRARVPWFEFPHAYGLGIVNVGPVVSAALAPLFSADARTVEYLHSVYATLGINMDKSRIEASITAMMEYSSLLAERRIG